MYWERFFDSWNVFSPSQTSHSFTRVCISFQYFYVVKERSAQEITDKIRERIPEC
jgi:hypothetical protein